jgi:capsular exopolysaccharide synthesis family protein
MDLRTYLYPLRRWWWLIAAATIVAAVSSFIVSLTQPPVYEARVTLMIGRALDDPNPSANQFWLGQRLAATYADMANRELVRRVTMESMGVNWLPSYRARALNETQLIEITVVDTVPARAQLVANELARQLVLQTPTAEGEAEQARQAFINAQLDELEASMEQTRQDIQQRQAELNNLFSARAIRDTQNEIAALQGKLNTLQSNYANLYSNTQGGAINTLVVLEPALEPRRPVGPNTNLAVAIAALIGLILASGAAYLLEYLDDSLKTPRDIEQVFKYPVIGYLGDISDERLEQPFVAKRPRHPISEAFRTLRTNLEFAGVDKPLKSILVSSSDSNEGKTSVSVNLAAVLAQGEKKVVLVDADLRMPSVHDFMSMTNEIGMTDVFRGRATLQNALRLWRDGKIAVVTSGSIPPNPAELLGSKKMDQIITSLEEAADVVIVDGPPFVVADAAVISSKVDGVLLVVRPGYTRRAAAKAMAENIERSGARVLGVVLNRIPSNLVNYYTGQVYAHSYYSGSPYFPDDEGFSGKGGKKRWQESFSRFTRGVSSSGQSKARNAAPRVPEVRKGTTK